MKTEEDEAFDDLAKKQGDWGGGFTAKRKMAADKLQEDLLNYGTAWSQDGERIDPMSVYKEQPAQEPVKCAVRDCQNHMHQGQFVGSVCLPCYITPPQREWVGLTDEEIDAMWIEWKDAVCLDHKTWAQAIQAKVKEKNNGT